MNAMFGLTAIFVVGCHVTSAVYLKLSITPLGKTIIAKENDDLNLTCRVAVPEPIDNRLFQLNWVLPIKKSSSENRVFIYEGHNERTVNIRKLRESDSGEYMCEVSDRGDIGAQKINIQVKTGKESCIKPFFTCENGLCIAGHYVCDGHRDCPDGSDESLAYCGHDACKGKMFCDGRCIPTKLCCDSSVDPNCSVTYLRPCCGRYNAMLPLDIPVVGIDGQQDIPVQYKYHNFGFYQSTVYTMISCAVAFIFMSTVMLIAVCRFRMRNTPWFLHSSQSNQRQRFWQNSVPRNERRGNASNARQSTALNLQHCPTNLDQHDMLDPENFVLLTFDANTGFEIAEYGPKPPPYTESNIGIPPPPYSSMVDITSGNANNTTAESNSLPENTNQP